MYRLDSPNVQEASQDTKISVVAKPSSVTDRDVE
jgi:hypothetical protein